MFESIRGALRALLIAAGTAALVAGCATSTPSGALARYDLGPPTMPAAASASAASAASGASTGTPDIANTANAAALGASGAARLSPLKVVVNAPNWLDSDLIYYRLPASDGDQARVYANSRWLASPARLFGDRLRVALAVDRPVLAAGDPTAAPALRVELDEFAQYFDSASTSHGVVQIRATLFDGPKLLAQTTLRAQAPAATADAAGGTRALAAASDAVQTQLIQWLAGRVPAPSTTTRSAPTSHAVPATAPRSDAAPGISSPSSSPLAAATR
ncbi:ABC-type transport auxiliary lipoprotein family protein [Pandoraea norimbergensis]|nr:ABC-type transport auxiliary lipoprotein family protein [Pandoraea norimbergensis]